MTPKRAKTIQQRMARWAQFPSPPICQTCDTRPCLRSRWIRGNAKCTTCFNRQRTRWATTRRYQRKRIRIGGRSLYAKTHDQADLMRAHIKRRRREFVAGFPAGTQAQSAA